MEIDPTKHSKEYIEKNKERLTQYHKKYYETHKDKYNEYNRNYNKNYYENNKLKFLEKTKCSICGKCYSMSSKSNHYKTKYHLNSQKLLEKDTQINDLKTQLTKITANNDA